MARPKKNTVDYFPHDCNPNRYLKILTSKYGNDGYAVYYRLNEVLGKTPNHSVSYTEPIDKEYLSMEMGTSIEKLDEILTTMVLWINVNGRNPARYGQMNLSNP